MSPVEDGSCPELPMLGVEGAGREVDKGSTALASCMSPVWDVSCPEPPMLGVEGAGREVKTGDCKSESSTGRTKVAPGTGGPTEKL